MSILIAGGAGYIGSHTVAELLKTHPENEIITVDSLETGHRDSILGGKFYQGNLRDSAFLEKVFSENNIEEVIDFAAYSLVGESMQVPLKYYENNIESVISLLKTMIKFGTKRIVFSSTAATYGEPENTPILETDVCNPTNTYGATKLSVESMLKWVGLAHGIEWTVMRYFNAAGAIESGEIGERHSPETHLIPLVLQVANGTREKIMVFGNDYETPDGTCIRDYIHVTDLADAHIKALSRMKSTGESKIYNLGNGKGFSVMEVIETCRKVTGHPIPAEICERRAGDPAILVASSAKAAEELNWHPKYPDLESIVATAWNFHKQVVPTSITYR